ncbi:unnamed protein product [Trichobilharzia szidati]|nr:unnamed protein product [Trichobilharzia szidati]
MEMSSINHNYRKRNWSDPDYLASFNHQTSGTTSDTLNPHHRTLPPDENEHSTVSVSVSRSSPPPPPPPIKRVANERERTRTASVNDAFLMLRSLIPTEPINRKLSKIETLRLASSYISHLHAILVTGSNPADQPCLRHQRQILTYPSDVGADNNNMMIDGNYHQENQRLYEQNKKYRSVCTFCVTEMKHHLQQQQQSPQQQQPKQRGITDMNKETILSGGQ